MLDFSFSNCRMNNNRSDKDSYSYWEWRFSIALRGGSQLSDDMEELTENGRKWVRIDSNYMLLPIFILIPLMLFIMVLIFSAFGDADTWSEPFRTIAIIIPLPLLLLAVLVMDFIIFPGKGRIAHAAGYITDNELRVILQRRVPYSIFCDPKNTPPAFGYKPTYIRPVIHLSRWAVAARYFSVLSILFYPAPIALVLGIIALRHCHKHSLAGKTMALRATLMGAAFSLALITIIFLVLSGK